MRTLKEALTSEDFTLTASLSMTRGQNAHELANEARLLVRSVDTVQIPDNAFGRPRISNMAAAALLIRDGIDPIIHMNCRDRNRLAVQSDLLGAQALGVSNVLLVRGKAFAAKRVPRCSSVFDLSVLDLLHTAAAIRDKQVLSGGRLSNTAELHIGTVATAFSPAATWHPEKLLAKAAAGAQFIQLQVCMDTAALREYTVRLVEAKLTWRFRILVNVAIFPSTELARQFKKFRTDAIIPDELYDRLEKANDPRQEGINLSASLLREMATIPGIAGANLISLGDPESIIETISASGLIEHRHREDLH